jgi:hypothetical protein
MDVYVDEFVSTVHAVDGDSLLTPQTWARIRRLVLEMLREYDEYRERVQAEQRITGGIRQWQEEEWR